MEPTKRGPGRPRQTECKRGHSLADALVDARGNRFCRKCQSLRHAAWRAAHPARWAAIRDGAKARFLARQRAGENNSD